MVIDDDRPPQNGGIAQDEINEFAEFHRVEIDVVFHDDFAARGDDVIGAVLALDDDLKNLTIGQFVRKDVLAGEGDFLLLEPLDHFPAAATTRRIINFDHGVIVAPYALRVDKNATDNL